MDAGTIERELDDLETRIERLRALYEQYFMGIEKLEPQIPRKEVERRIQVLRREQIRNTALRFKFQMLVQRYNTMQQYWARVTREIENGTYRRDVMRAAARFGAKEALTILGKRRAQKYAALAEAQAAQKTRQVGGEEAEAEEIDVEPEDDEVELGADDLIEEAAPVAAASPPPVVRGAPVARGAPAAKGAPAARGVPVAKEALTAKNVPIAKDAPVAKGPSAPQGATPTPAGLGGLRWGQARPAEKSAAPAPPAIPGADPRSAVRVAPAPVVKAAAESGVKSRVAALAAAARTPPGQRGPTAGGDTATGIGALDLDFDDGPIRPARKAPAAPAAIDLDDLSLDLDAIAPNKK